jgi:hypothetical protein
MLTHLKPDPIRTRIRQQKYYNIWRTAKYTNFPKTAQDMQEVGDFLLLESFLSSLPHKEKKDYERGKAVEAGIIAVLADGGKKGDDMG